MPYADPKDPRRAAVSRKHYEKNTEAYIERRKKQRLNSQAHVARAKDKPCTDCGGSFPPVCMDFDHLSDKIGDISKMAYNGSSIARLDREMAKCELVCANCHRIRTAARLL